MGAVAGLTIRLHSHACIEISRNGFTLLTDPWLDGPAFFSAWAPSPAPAVTGRELRPDAILITHEHSDHFHEPTLRHFDRGTAVYIPDFPNQRLQKRLAALGFTNVHVLRFGERHGVGADWSLTAFEPDSYWNDALVLIDAAGFRLFDINDAGINPRIARMVGAVDLLAVQFSAGASGYPWTWTHLTDAQKVGISEQMCAGKLKLIREAAATYHASAVLPFASHFALWHDEHLKHAGMMKRNSLADVTAAMAGSGARVLDLMPGDAWDGTAGHHRAGHARRGDVRSRGVRGRVSHRREPVTRGTRRVSAAPQRRAGDHALRGPHGAHDRRASVPGRSTIDVAFAIAGGRLAMLADPPARANLTMAMPLSILTAVVRQDLSWDEAFIGYWCEFESPPQRLPRGLLAALPGPVFPAARPRRAVGSGHGPLAGFHGRRGARAVPARPPTGCCAGTGSIAAAASTRRASRSRSRPASTASRRGGWTCSSRNSGTPSSAPRTGRYNSRG